MTRQRSQNAVENEALIQKALARLSNGIGMTITTSGPPETAKTRNGSRTAPPTEPEPIKDCITVETESKDAFKKGNNMSGTEGFLPSKKISRSPPQVKA